MTRTPLHKFGMKYRVDEYTAMVAGGDYDVNAQDADGKTPLHYATEQGVTPVVMCLLEAGANPNIQETRFGKSPLSNAVFYIRELGPEVVERMVDLGADPTIVTKDGVSPLSLANMINNLPQVQQVLPALRRAAAAFEQPG
ncbi:MAG: ankyrin repeat domain-containing protein [Mycobacteriaceae bacterium]|nr:ankyrin repeat domain-containing protein [Mycobacteriaceae bacterium]